MSVKIREDEVISSPEDKRLYRGLLLSNDLKVILVSDPTTDKSAASLDVHIGCFSDPRSLPGLAHFCEHMLFMGTEKYPCENDYNKYLSENGGSSNAYTGADHTNYYFDVSPDALSGALDRFSQFFICPLFSESCVEREVNAVDSEHKKNIQNDYWRLMQLDRSTSNKDHDYCKFGTGNKETLMTIPKSQNIDVRAELLNFHKKWYSANVMGLSILGKESLDELEKYAVDLFSCVKSHDVEVPSWPDHPFRPEECKKEINVVPVKDIRNLCINFPIPDLHPYYKSAPGSLLGHLIGHEGPGSLLSYLKGRGWVSNLSGGEMTGAKGFGFFIVNVDLTEEGIKETDDIVQAIFEYLSLLKQEGVKEWVFDECKALNEIAFRFKDKERPMSYVCTLAELLHRYPLNETIYGRWAMSKYDAELISWVLSMLVPEKLRVTVIGKANECKADTKEVWYGTDYCLNELSEEKLQKWRDPKPNDELKLPSRNDFIPSNFDLCNASENISEFPAMICQNELCSVWYKLDTEFKLPKACLYIELFSPLAYMDPNHVNLMQMFVQLYKDNLTEFSYAAQLAGINYSMSNTKYGVTIAVHGYTDTQSCLLQKLIDEFVSFKIDPKRFEILKDNYVRAMKNFACEQPHSHLVYYTSLIFSEQAWSKEDQLQCIDELTIKNLEAFVPRFLSSLHVEALVHGSMSREKAEEMCAMVLNELTQKLGTKALATNQYKRMQEKMLQPGSSFVYESETTVHKSSAVEDYFQFGLMNSRNNMLSELLVQIISEPAFDQLRTKEQLGYVVWCTLRRSHGTQGLRVIIQGEKHPRYLDSRIEAFLHKMKTYLNDLSSEDYEKHLSALAKQRLERPKMLTHLASRWWTEITSNHLHFNRDEVEVEELRTITKDQLLEFYDTFVAYDSPQRRKLSVQVLSVVEGGAGKVENSEEGEKIEGEEVLSLKKPEVIEDINGFKSTLELFPAVKPSVPLVSLLAQDSKSKL